MAYALTSAKLGNGEVVVRNGLYLFSALLPRTIEAGIVKVRILNDADHIYVSPPWSMRDGTAYSIARIIEFLPPNAAHKKGARTTQSAAAIAQANEVHVKISLFYRPSDAKEKVKLTKQISGRNISDFRLLLAAIHTDIQPLSNIRGKCYVRHKDRIDDLLSWKRKPDHFYFARFYDPYIKREFEVIRTESVNNIPQDVKEVLMSRYEYLITERDMIQDLTDTYKTCCVCEQWASTQEAVKCEACKLHYHMRCLNPPLLAKPAKGYSWVCPPCSAQRHKDVQDARYLFGGSSAPKQATKAAQKKEKSAATNRADVMFRGWPWRYFGQFTSARDTLDPDDLIFPRAATRVGQKFQATVPTWEVQQAAEAAHRAHQFVEGEAGPSRHIAVERGHDIGERKNESTYDVWCTPSADLNAYMQDVFKLNLPVDIWDVERLNRAVKLYTQHGRDKAYNMMRKSRLADFNPIIFSAQEQVIYETEQEHWGGIDAIEIGKLLKRPASDVLRFTYIWRCRKLHEENRAHRVNKDIKQAAHGRQSRTLGAPSLGRMRVGANAAGANAEDEDDDKSYYGGEFVKENKMQCAACSTRLGEIWWRCPRTVNGIAMCESCGANYRKYGVISFTKAEDSKKPEKKDVVANKKGKGETSSASTPAPAPTPRQPPCACCKRTEPKFNMARCKNCTFSVHSGCYGIPSQDMGPNWLCELCHNAEENDNHLQPRCLLCPRDNSIAIAKIKSKRAPSDFDMLSALKPTEGRQWAHVLCSAWMSEIIYTQPSRMKAVEGITNLSLDRWTITCSLCDQLDGAVVSCTDCDTFFHPSCAWLLGYKFGFEFALGSLAPGKAGKRDLAEVTKFKEEEGVMYPGCWCKKHDLEGRRIYDAWDIDPEQNETALQIYTSTYKRLPAHDETFALLRKAQRLDEITANGEDTLHPHLLNGTANGGTGVAVSNGVETTVCASCGTDVSPRWYDAPTTITAKEEFGQQAGHPVGEARVCHICHFDQLAELEDASGGMEIDG